MSKDCLFCGIVADDVPSAKVAETETTVADVAIESQRITKHVVDAWGADGVNLLNCCGEDAWQTVFHFHMQVIPRYRDKGKDRLRLPFEPGVCGDAELIEKMAGSMRSALQED